jgi:hypothetical protein
MLGWPRATADVSTLGEALLRLSVRPSREVPEVTTGAGTVLSVAEARAALDAGAAFIVSPHLDEELVRFCAGAGVPAGARAASVGGWLLASGDPAVVEARARALVAAYRSTVPG